MSILLKEGRKESLKLKYSEKFKEYPHTLDWILDDEFLSEKNHKYTEFALKHFIPTPSKDRINTLINLIKDFDKYQGRLKNKDINQYSGFAELGDEIQEIKSKIGTKPEIEKIYEDDNFLVIIPKNKPASCKYGANTKWCVTQKNENYFDVYTSGNQALYFIINKKRSSGSVYSKIAVHVTDSGDFSYWDSLDKPMTNKEVEVFQSSFPKMMNSIKEHYDKTHENNYEITLKKIFNEYGETYVEFENFLNSNYSLWIYVDGFELIDDISAAQGKLTIFLSRPNSLGSEKISDYLTMVNFKQTNNNKINCSFMFTEWDFDSDMVDLELENEQISGLFSNSVTVKYLRDYLAYSIFRKIQNNKNLISKVLGPGQFWKSNSGYKFKSNKGLIKKLINYLDSNNVGTKLDFLVKSGRLKTKNENGNTLYSIAGQDNYRKKSDLRGHFSSFFASAKHAGIISYKKEGNKYIIVKGPNFDDFKKGTLKSI